MPEHEYEVMVTETEYLCDECREPVRPRGFVALDTSYEYEHICKNGHEVRLKDRYPLRRYWRADG